MILKWIKLLRPATLLVTICPVLLAFFVVLRSGSFFDIGIATLILIAGVAIQVVCNLVNDYYDFKKGSDSKNSVNNRSFLATGYVSLSDMKIAIGIAMFIAIIAGFSLVLVGGIPILIIGLSSLLFAWLYTATRFSLSYLGVADIFAFLYFGPIACAGTLYLLDYSWVIGAVLGIGHGAISMAVLTVNNIRDIDQDRKSNKQTIIVRLGTKFGYYYYLFALILPQIILFITTNTILSFIYLPFAVVVYSLFLSSKGSGYNRILALTCGLNIIFLFVYIVSSIFY